LDVRRQTFGTLFVPDFQSFFVGEAFQHLFKIDYLRPTSIVFFDANESHASFLKTDFHGILRIRV